MNTLTHFKVSSYKILFGILIIIVASMFYFATAFAAGTTYYVSSTLGSDANTGTSTSSPWQTLSKVNSANLSAGDTVLFERGGTYTGTLNITKSGTLANPITFGAYGSGAKPLISGFNFISSWTNLGSNKWESTSAASTLSSVNMVTINGTNTPIGRWPNTGYRTITGHSGNTSITDSSLTGTPNWAGAEIVVRRDRWTIDRNPITSHSGSTINYTGTGYDALDGFGYFIQNSPLTLDTQNEWYYNPSTKKIQVYSTSSPVGVKVSTTSNLINTNTSSYLVFDNLALEGANGDAITSNGGSHIAVNNSDVNFSGNTGINASDSTSFLVIQNSTINNSNDSGIHTGNANNITVSHNIISNSGFIAGMGGNRADNYEGILAVGSNVLIEYNQISNVGYNAIEFNGANTIVNNNLIDTYCALKDDGAAIYAWNDGSNPTNFTGRKVQNNIILNGLGAGAGTDQPGDKLAEGIYMDDNSANVEISGNTVANSGDDGVYLHNAHEINLHDNTLYNNTNQLNLTQDTIPTNNSPLRNITSNNNILVSKTSSQWILNAANRNGNGVNFGTYNNNFYGRPVAESSSITACQSSSCSSFPWPTYSLSSWKTFSNQDLNSQGSPVTLSNINDILFDYNASDLPKVISLANNYVDMRNNYYTSTATIAPWSSIVLLKSSTTPPPPTSDTIAPVVSITSPVNNSTALGTTTISASATDNVGVTKVDFYQGTILIASDNTYPYSAIWNTTTVANGTYILSAKAYDAAGNVGVSSNVQVTVNNTVVPPPTNLPPVVNAGIDQVITLPVNTVIVNGTATDPENNSMTYLWTKISGGSATITSPSTLSTTITGLSQGTYTFWLTATDSFGASNADAIMITVNGVVVPPVGDTQAPVVSLTSPISNANVTGRVTLRAIATDNVRVTRVRFYRDATLVGTDTTSPYSVTWNTSGIAKKSYILSAKAYDAAGNVGVSNTVAVTVR